MWIARHVRCRLNPAGRAGRLALVATAALAGLAQAQTPPAKPAVKPPARSNPPRPAPAAAPAQPPRLPDPPIPVAQARDAGLGQCAPTLDAMARQTLTQPYDVQSGWARADAGRHVFQSVAAMSNPANKPADGFAALIAAPVTAGGCDGVAVEVFPLAGDCQSAAAFMIKGGQTATPLMNARIMIGAAGARTILLPGAANTCVAISVNTRFEAP